MKKLTLALVITCLLSCRAIPYLNRIEGVYEKTGVNFSYEIQLNPDNSFIFRETHFGIRSICKGVWSDLGNRWIELNCFPESVLNQLSRGYINKRSRKIKILAQNKIQMESLKLNKLMISQRLTQ
jgi:hypothetical protein